MPASAGIGLKPTHYQALLAEQPALGFLEVHTENYMGAYKFSINFKCNRTSG
jgi:uncharacterized protein (UPF0276 family)